MAITINALIEEMKEPFQLKYLAGSQGGEHAVTWVHLMEDVSVAELFVGNELVVTSGYAARTEAALLEFVEKINRKPIAGLVINIGKYILTVPQSVIDKCNEYRIPLLTMPWKVNATEFVKACCGKIEENTRETEQLNQAAMWAIQSPNNESAYITDLTEYFDCSAGFQVLSIDVNMPDMVRKAGVSRAELRIHTALYKISQLFLLFQLDQRMVLILNQINENPAEEVADQILNVYLRQGGDINSIHIGIGEPVEELTALSKSYHSALAAVRRGAKLNRSVMRFQDMGFYKLLYSVPDDAILSGYYDQRMAPLLEYDKTHDGSYVETLFRYLLNDGSLSAVADQMYTHRNTVNYRMGKIRELLGRQLNTTKDRFPLVLAFHIGVILDRIPDYETDIQRWKEARGAEEEEDE